MLLLDEPTNALDFETIDALADAINQFQGGLVLISHDFRLINQVAKEIWVCEKLVPQFFPPPLAYVTLVTRASPSGLETFSLTRSTCALRSTSRSRRLRSPASEANCQHLCFRRQAHVVRFSCDWFDHLNNKSNTNVI